MSKFNKFSILSGALVFLLMVSTLSFAGRIQILNAPPSKNAVFKVYNGVTGTVCYQGNIESNQDIFIDKSQLQTFSSQCAKENFQVVDVTILSGKTSKVCTWDLSLPYDSGIILSIDAQENINILQVQGANCN